jgi:hypothetical protein
MNRETWLEELVVRLKPLFKEQNIDLPENIRISCGWPSKKAIAKIRSLGQCWDTKSSKSGKNIEIFISPYIEDKIRVADVTIHELIHACGNWNHRKEFKRIARAIGLTGPANSTEAGDELKARLVKILEGMEEYPHSSLDGIIIHKQPTRMHKVVCLKCGYTIRISEKWIEKGLPRCICSEDMVEA